jgi:hypothetical protein
MAESGTVNNGVEKIQVWGPMVDAQVGIRMLDPRSDLTITPRLHSTFFPTDHADQSTDGYLDLKGEYRTQKSAWDLVGNYADETVILSELLPASFPGVGLGQVVGGESGRVSIRNRRKLEHLAPEYRFDLTPREHLVFDVDFARVRFNRTEVEQIGFRNYFGRAGLSFDLSQRSNIQVSVVGSHFDPDIGATMNRYGLQGQWNLKPSRILNAYFRLGADRTQADIRNAADTTGVTGGAGVIWSYQITQIVVDALRDLSPSASGAIAVHDELRFRVLRTLTPRLSGFVGARAIRLRGANQRSVPIQGSDYAAAQGGFEYQVTRNWHVAGTYDYTWQHFQGEPHAASNGVVLSVVYQPLSKYEPLPELYGVPTGRP